MTLILLLSITILLAGSYTGVATTPVPGPAPVPAPAPTFTAVLTDQCPQECGRNPFALPNGILGGVGPVVPSTTMELRAAVGAKEDGQGGLCGAASMTPAALAAGVTMPGRTCEAVCECCASNGTCGCGPAFCGRGCQTTFSKYCS